MATSRDEIDTGASAQQADGASCSKQTPAHSCSDFDTVLDHATSRHKLLAGEPWIDSVAMAAGRGSVVFADEHGFIGCARSAEIL
jgi:hypothetical protein